MPELPEVETTARGLRNRILGRGIVGVGGMDWPRMLPNAAATDFQSALLGLFVEIVDRRGKYLLLGVTGDVWLAIHRKMSGNLVLRPAHTEPERHTHLSIWLDDNRRLDFVDARKFGRIYLFPSRDALYGFLDAKLGPEPLVDLTAPKLKTMLSRRRGRIKPLLMDQTFLAGLGNLYVDEILWAARIHPLRDAGELSSLEVGRLAESIVTVLEEAIERRGTSLSDYVDAEGEPGSNQDFLRVYGRAGEPCTRCGALVERIVVGQRGTWYCRRCQRLKR